MPIDRARFRSTRSFRTPDPAPQPQASLTFPLRLLAQFSLRSTERAFTVRPIESRPRVLAQTGSGIMRLSNPSPREAIMKRVTLAVAGILLSTIGVYVGARS